MKHNRLLIWFLILAVAVISCDPRTVFDNYAVVEKSGWNKDSVKTFQVRINDSLQYHNIYVNLRNRSNYNYSNIWLFIGIKAPDGNFINDTVQFVLADPSGRWYGKGFGGIKDNRFLYRSSVYFPRKGDYLFTISQGMRKDVLTGITDIGFRVEKK
jgi:gliding motility-associated lipoprotein GldH